MEVGSYDDLVSICPDAIIGINRDGIITLFNSAAVRLSGYESTDVIGKMHIKSFYNPPESARAIKKLIYSDEYGKSGRLEDFEAEAVSKSGRIIPLLLSATIIKKDGKEIGSIGFFHDLTAVKQMENKLWELSVTDSLTGLFNHRYFHIKIDEEINRYRRYKRTLSLVCFDFDNFKQLNDQLGHLEGDKLLRIAGKSITAILRNSDLAFRYGGDEFMIILPETNIKDAELLAKRIMMEFDSRWPFEFTGKKINLNKVTLSIGIAEADSKDNTDSLVRRADMVMYEAKKNGGNKIILSYDISNIENP